jgi:glycosyltransferase involved in cell wall biosynthesis
MKIFQLINSLGNGGAEKFVIELSNQLSTRHNVLLCPFKPVEDWMIFPKMLSQQVVLKSLNKEKGFDLGVYKQLYRLFRTEKPDVVHFHLDATIKYILPLVPLFKKVKFVYTIHSNLNADKITLFRKLNRFRFLAGKVNYVCISESIYSEFKTAYPGLRFSLITNGISQMALSSKSQQVEKEVQGYKPNVRTKVFLTVGNYSQPKNFQLIVEVFRRLYEENENVILLMIGNDSDPARTEWKKIERQKAPNTFMLGLKNNVQDYLSVSDAYCLCSIFEGLPISILEAYSFGRPVLSTPAGGIPSILKNSRNGLLAGDFTPDSYYAMMKEFLRLPESDLAKIKEHNLSDFMSRYTIKTTSENYLLNYNN